MPFKVLNSRTIIIAGEKALSKDKLKKLISSVSIKNPKPYSFNYFYLLLLNKAWKDIPIHKVKKIYELLNITNNNSLTFSKNIIFFSPRNGSQSP